MNMLTSGARHLARLPSRRTRAVPIQTTTNAMAIVLRHQVRTVMSVYQNTPTTFQSATAAVAVDEVHQQQQPDERRRAFSMNTVTLVGNIIKDPRIIVTSNDRKMTFITVATNKADFIDVNSFSQTLASHIEHKRIQKGDLVYVLGSLNRFKDKQGHWRMTVEVETLRKLEKTPNSGDE